MFARLAGVPQKPALKSVIAGQIPFSQQQIAEIDKQSERKNVGFSSVGAELSNSLDYGGKKMERAPKGSYSNINVNAPTSDGRTVDQGKTYFSGDGKSRGVRRGNLEYQIRNWRDTQIDDVLNNNKTNVLDASTGIPTYNSSSNSAARQQAILRRSRSSSTSLLGG
jgi:hypothetical protein